MSKSVLSFKVGATTIAAQRIVAVSDNTIYLPTTAAGTAVIGITEDVAQTGQGAAVITSGLAQLYFNDSVASGTYVQADSSGYGVPITANDTEGSYVIGVLADAKVNDTGTVAWVLVNPGHISTEA